MNKIFCLITLFVLLSSACSSEKQKEAKVPETPETVGKSATESTQVPPFVSPEVPAKLEIVPEDASRNTIFSLIMQNINPSEAKIEWLINGATVPRANSPQFRAIEAKRGDDVQARAIVKGHEILSNIVKIKNAPPELSMVKIMPEVFSPGDTLYVDVSGTDLDEDEVTILYEWTKNGEPAGKGKWIEVPIKRGDKVSIKITPFDGEIYGRPIVLHREIRNLPPMIIKDKEFDFDGKVYTYRVKAEDPDGDSLTFSLKSAPEGMTIDPTTGLIQWDVPPDFKGNASLTLSVTDDHGGEAIQSFTLEMTQELRRVIE